MANITFTFDVNLQRIKLKSSTELKTIVAGSNNLYYVHVDFSPLWDGATKKIVLRHWSAAGTDESTEYTWTGEDIQIPSSYYGTADNVGDIIRVSVYGQTMYEGINLSNSAELVVAQSETEIINPPEMSDNSELYVKTPNTAQESGIAYIKKNEDGVLCYWDETAGIFIPVQSAYQAALKGGYTGTETEFYAELSGIAKNAQTAQESAQSAAENAQNTEELYLGTVGYAQGAATQSVFAENSAKQAAASQTAAETANESAQAAASQAQTASAEAQTAASEAKAANESAQTAAQTAARTLESKANKTNTVLESSVSMGRAAGTTVGASSVAMGASVEASASGAVAIGGRTAAKGMASIAGGLNTKALGSASVALGQESVCGEEADGSAVIGIKNRVDGKQSLSVGFGRKSIDTDGKTDEQLVAEFEDIGDHDNKKFHLVTGDGSISVGMDNLVTGNESAAFGQLCEVIGGSSLAVGTGAKVVGDHRVAFGKLNSTEGDPYFAVGCGSWEVIPEPYTAAELEEWKAVHPDWHTYTKEDGSISYCYDVRQNVFEAQGTTLCAWARKGVIVGLDAENPPELKANNYLTHKKYVDDEVSAVRDAAPNFTRQLKDMCAGRAYVDYTNVGPLPSYANNTVLETVFAPACTEVGLSKFTNCTALKQLYLPAAEDVSSSFMGCTALTEVYLPSVKYVQSSAFEGCTSLQKADLGANIITIGVGAFRNCIVMNILILRAPSVVTMTNSNAVTGTIFAKGAGSIYVPDELVEDYKAAANWKYYQSAIKPLSEWEE